VTHTNAIQGALPILARAVGRQLNVDVRIGGSQAFTDGKTIQLPALPFDNIDEIEPLAFGYLEHEAAHLRYSELPLKASSALHHAITNIFEDIRVESRLFRAYPGFARTLRQLITLLVRDGLMTQPQPADELTDTLFHYLLYRLRCDVLGQEAVSQFASDAERYFVGSVPADVAARIGSVLGRVRDLETTQQAAKLAQEVIDLFKDAVEPPQSPDSSSGGQKAEEMDPSDAASGSDNQGKSSSSETGAAGEKFGGSSDSPGSASEKDDGDSSQEAQSGPPSSSEPGSGDPADPARPVSRKEEAAPTPTQVQALRDLLNSDPSPDAGTLGKTIADKLTETAAGVSSAGCAMADAGYAPSELVTSGDPHAILSSVAAATAALRLRLRRYVEATRRTRRCHTRQGKHLSGRRLVRAVMGDPYIYKRNRKGVGVNTAVVLLLDRSYSMATGNRIGVARRSALACASALEDMVGVSVAAAAFPGYRRPLDILTGFGEAVRNTAQRYQACTATGGTPMLEAILWAADVLLQAREPRKMLLVVTDGDPFNREGCDAAIRRCWRGGIEVMGIGIAIDVSALFPIFTTVTDMPDLAPAMFQMLQDALTRRPAF